MQESSFCFWVWWLKTILHVRDVHIQWYSHMWKHWEYKHECIIFKLLFCYLCWTKVGHFAPSLKWQMLKLRQMHAATETVTFCFKSLSKSLNSISKIHVIFQKDTVASSCTASITLTYSVLVVCIMSQQWQVQEDCVILRMPIHRSK